MVDERQYINTVCSKVIGLSTCRGPHERLGLGPGGRAATAQDIAIGALSGYLTASGPSTRNYTPDSESLANQLAEARDVADAFHRLPVTPVTKNMLNRDTLFRMQWFTGAGHHINRDTWAAVTGAYRNPGVGFGGVSPSTSDSAAGANQAVDDPGGDALTAARSNRERYDAALVTARETAQAAREEAIRDRQVTEALAEGFSPGDAERI